MKPVRPGERGGRYHPFTDQDLEAIVENIYRILEEVGFKDATPHCIATCEAVGAALGDDGRLRMPRAVVDAALKRPNAISPYTHRIPSSIWIYPARGCTLPRPALP